MTLGRLHRRRQKGIDEMLEVFPELQAEEKILIIWLPETATTNNA